MNMNEFVKVTCIDKKSGIETLILILSILDMDPEMVELYFGTAYHNAKMEEKDINSMDAMFSMLFGNEYDRGRAISRAQNLKDTGLSIDVVTKRLVAA